MEHLKSSNIVLIAGKQFTGKRTLIKYLQKEFHRHRFTEPKDRFFSLDDENVYFICVTHNWIGYNSIDSLENEMSKLHNDCKLVIEISADFLKKNRAIKEKYQHVTVDLSSEQFELNSEEKLQIVNDICHHKDVSEQELSNETRTELSNYRPVNYGFLHLCHALFRADQESLSEPLSFIRKQDKVPCTSGKFLKVLYKTMGENAHF